jgi:hypothetical protein
VPIQQRLSSRFAKAGILSAAISEDGRRRREPARSLSRLDGMPGDRREISSQDFPKSDAHNFVT